MARRNIKSVESCKSSSEFSKMFSKSDLFGLSTVFILYTLQGVTFGLAGCVPMVLQDKGIGYADQAVFSLAFWPFSLKILWAPIVDAIHIKKIGLRKTWVVLAQSIIAAMLATISFMFDDLAKDRNIVAIAAFYFVLIFMLSIQDISVDGWALTLISEDGVGAAANMQTVGQMMGSLSWNIYFSFAEERIGYSRYIRYWAIVYLASTLLVLLLVKEKKVNKLPNVARCYLNLFRLLTLKPVLLLIFLCLTCKMGFAPHGEAFTLKLRERCVEKKLFSQISLVMKPISILINSLLIKFTIKNPLNTLLVGYVLYQCTTCASAILVWKAEELVEHETILWSVLFYDIVAKCTASAFYLSATAFFFTIADPMMGGVYMTLLNSVFNMGGMWVETLSLKLLDEDDAAKNQTYCDKYNETNRVHLDEDNSYQYTGWDKYYILAIGAFAVGTLWFVVIYKIVKKIDAYPKSAWRLKNGKTEDAKKEDSEEEKKSMIDEMK